MVRIQSGVLRGWCQLENLSREEGAIIRSGGYKLCQIYGFKMDPVELAEKTNTPVYQSGSLAMSKLTNPE